MRKFLFSLLEILEVVLVAFGSVFIIRSSVAQPFLVSGSSMFPSFSDGNYLLVDELTYRFRQPQRGEVVVFRYPGDTSVYFIKRIIGLPGEIVEIKDNRVFIYNESNPDGFALNEKYLPVGDLTSGNMKIKVSAGQYFVMGDNREYSFDSRSWGTVPQKDLVGLVDLRLWPPSSIKAFAAPKY